MRSRFDCFFDKKATAKVISKYCKYMISSIQVRVMTLCVMITDYRAGIIYI